MKSETAQRVSLDGERPDVSGVRESLVDTFTYNIPHEFGASGSRAAESRLGATVVGRWQLLRIVGAGSVGSVYEARHVQTGDRAAVKLLHDAAAASREQKMRFVREAQMASSLRHPHVARVYEVGREPDGALYQIQELLEGKSLAAYVGRGPLCTRMAIRIGLQLLSALHAVHEAGFAHRDIKPENVVLLDTEGPIPHVKLVDFGIAKDLRPRPHMPGITIHGAVVGTPHYVSPEQLRGCPLTVHSDLWSTGALLYHVLSGHPPYHDELLHRLLVRIIAEPAPSLLSTRRDLPAHVIETVDRALRHDPSSRWKSASEMGRALMPRERPMHLF